MKIKTLLWIVIIFASISCKEKKTKFGTIEIKSQSLEDNLKNDSVFIATIGSIKISDQIIKYRIATESAYENTGLNMTTGLIMLINDALELELAKKYNQQAIPSEIEQFKEYANNTTKAPEILNKIKNVFGQDISSYDLWFISPKIVNRKIRDYFSANKSINQSTLNQIKPALLIVRSGKKMKDVAKSLQLTYAIDSISIKPQNMSPGIPNYPDAQSPFINPMLKYVKKMKVGEVYPQIIEENYSFLIIKLLNYNKGCYIIESISVPKPDFDSWFKNEAGNIQIEIENPDIKKELQGKYNNLWWVKYLN